jgi:hypothetical protein
MDSKGTTGTSSEHGPGRVRFHKLRIAFSIVCFTVCILALMGMHMKLGILFTPNWLLPSLAALLGVAVYPK